MSRIPANKQATKGVQYENTFGNCAGGIGVADPH